MVTQDQNLAPRKAYSYLRFSTPEQQKGDSSRRQSAMALDYAHRHKLELDQNLTFNDLGISGFRGQNSESGRLAYFLEAVQSGLVPEGSVLLVEQLDRISRLAPRKALRVLENIVDAGVSVVTLNDGREYTGASLDNDPLDLMVSILTFMRANEESATKSRRLKQAWGAKRANVGDKILTSRAPAWLRVDGRTKHFEPIHDRAALVERMFLMTAEGVGQHKIAETLNAERIRPWGRGTHWQRSYISKILSNPAVRGTLQPHTLEYVDGKRIRKPQDEVEGYYPSVVSADLWNDVQAILSGNRAASRGRHSSATITNILAGLATCPLCGGTATRVNKGPRSLPKLVCARAKSGGGCSYKSVSYSLVEAAIIQRLVERLKDIPAGEGEERIESQLDNMEHGLDDLRERLRNLIDQEEVSPSPALAERRLKLEDEYQKASNSRAALLEVRSARSGKLVQQRVARLSAALGDGADIPGINHALRSVFTHIAVNYVDGVLEFHWTHGGSFELPFAIPLNLPCM